MWVYMEHYFVLPYSKCSSRRSLHIQRKTIFINSCFHKWKQELVSMLIMFKSPEMIFMPYIPSFPFIPTPDTSQVFNWVREWLTDLFDTWKTVAQKKWAQGHTEKLSQSRNLIKVTQRLVPQPLNQPSCWIIEWSGQQLQVLFIGHKVHV